MGIGQPEGVAAMSRSLNSKYGGLKSWGNTADRTVRTAPARRNSPSSAEYWLEKLDPEKFADATGEQKAAAAHALRRAYFAKLAISSAKARRRTPRDAE